MSAPAVSIDTDGIRGLPGDLGAMAPVLRAELRRGLRIAGGKAGARAKANAAWSSRIPAAVQVLPLPAAGSNGVFLRVDRARAPHAAVLESPRKASRFFRHPVYGQTDVQVTQETRPFLRPAVRTTPQDVMDAAVSATNAAARAGRFT
jgi:hypothetical protein